MDWPRCYAFTARQEGGFVNNPNDPGGPTAKGVSLRRVIRLDRDRDGRLDFDLDNDGDVDIEDIRALMQDKYRGKVEDFYAGEYWEPVQGGRLPWPWDLLLYDTAVNCGVGAAVLMAQRVVEATPDGRMGPDTLRRIGFAPAFAQRAFLVQRSNLYGRLTAKLLHKLATARALSVTEYVAEFGLKGTFYDGWQQRLFDLQHEAWKRAA